jgi:hypothetical protein
MPEVLSLPPSDPLHYASIGQFAPWQALSALLLLPRGAVGIKSISEQMDARPSKSDWSLLARAVQGC